MYVVQFSYGQNWITISDPDLKVLAEFLPKAVVQSIAPATVKYAGAFGRWKKWASTKSEVVPFLAKPIHVALYLI